MIIINNAKGLEKRKKLEVAQGVVYDCTNYDYHYSHHPAITYYKGQYLALWSNGIRDEDAAGQRVLMATSQDGLNWSEPTELFSCDKGAVHFPAGWFIREDGVLNVYAGKCYETDTYLEYAKSTCLCKTSTDGENFNERYDFANEWIDLKFEGRSKVNGVYGYPNAVEVDGVITVIASIQKEDIRTFQFTIDQLQ